MKSIFAIWPEAPPHWAVVVIITATVCALAAAGNFYERPLLIWLGVLIAVIIGSYLWIGAIASVRRLRRVERLAGK